VIQWIRYASWPLSSEEALKDLLDQVNDLKAGAKVVTGGNRAFDEGAYMQPTLLTNLKRGEPTL
jgi:succinate-semialdehyde dehydrogenase/glutarate-semialdehyde dehydrogenase